MRTIFRVFSLIAILLPIAAFAAGGGGGGSIPTCSEDTWSCTDWSSCSTSGSQSRTCSLSFNCETADTPRPTEVQLCTPPAPTPPPAPAPASNNEERPASAPAPKESAKPQCTQSTWKCDTWSSKCDGQGLEHRSCRLVADCAESPTPSPETARACTHLQCGNKASLRERIECRLNLASEGLTRELTIQYLPEECRATKDPAEKKECIERYKSFNSCWRIQEGPGRFTCAQRILSFEIPVRGLLTSCDSKSGDAKSQCMHDVREKVLYMIKFRFYDLSQRAEALVDRGADVQAVADLETTIETKKQEFDAAKTKAEYQKIINDVRTAWQTFVSRVKDQIK